MSKFESKFLFICIALLALVVLFSRGKNEQSELVIEYVWDATTEAYLIEESGMHLNDAVISIPTEFNEIPVVGIIAGSFSGVTGESEIKIPETILTIGDGAFSNCTDVTSIYIPTSVKKIGNSAFTGCSNVETIIVDAGNAMYKSVDNCLISIDGETLILGGKASIIPNDGSVTAIGNRAFYGVIRDELVIPSTVHYIGEQAITGASKVIMSSSVTYIEPNAISKSCTICAPKGSYAAQWGIEKSYNVSYIEDYYDGPELESETYAFSFYLLEDGTYAIIGTQQDIPAEVVIPLRYQGILITQILSNSFAYREHIEKIKISGGVTTIGGRAFAGCSNMQEILIPDSVKYIGTNAFVYCTSLKEIIMPDSIEYISEYAFNSCVALEKAVISSSVTKLENGTFSGCKNLCYVEIPSSVEEIHDYAFWGCGPITIYTDANSYAAKWGAEKGYNVVTQ